MVRFLISILLIINCLALSTMAHAAQVDTVEIFSVSMRKQIRCVVITPSHYSIQNPAYPTLYLLHGWSGNYTGWLSDAPQIPQLADQYGMIVVCPDGGYDSWYLDSPVDTTVRYETHIVREVVAYMDYYYHTVKSPAGRAISGLSMGGHGALHSAIRHPEVFGAAGSMCGGLDLRPFKINNWDLKSILGGPLTHWKNWEAHSVVNLVPRLQGMDLPIIMDCGTGDFFLDVNREMHQRLTKAKVPHEYTERPGEHNSAYWGSAIDYQFVFFHKFFSKKKEK